MANETYDYSGIEEQLRQRAQQKGLAYDPSDLEDVKRHSGYDTGGITPDAALQNAFAKYDERATNTPGGGQSQQVQYATPTQAWNAQPAPAAAPQNELYALLMQRAQQGTAVGRDNPNVRNQVDPVVAQQERANRNYLDDTAERAGPLANLQGERRLMAERSGQYAGALESEVIGREIEAKRQEIMQALSLWGQQLSADQRLALQRELAYLEDAARTADRGLQREGLLQGNDQFLRELALRESDQNNAWDYRWTTLGL